MNQRKNLQQNLLFLECNFTNNFIKTSLYKEVFYFIEILEKSVCFIINTIKINSHRKEIHRNVPLS